MTQGALTEFNPDPGWLEEPSGNGDPQDAFAILRRHPFVLSVSILISLGLGVLYYAKTPPVYESYVDILIEPKQAPVFSAETLLEQKANQKSVATHTYSLASPVIVQRALDKIGIPPSFRESENPVASVVDSLSVNVVADESNVISLSCRSTSRQDCYEIVSAIVRSYEAFLGELSENVGEETTSLIGQAKDDLMVQLRDHEQRYREFRQHAPLIWQDGKGVNTHHERQLQVEAARSELAIERSRLQSKLDGLFETLSQPVGKKVVFFAAINELTDLDGPRYAGAPHLIVDRENARVLADEVLKLMSREAKLSEEFGDGHPELVAVRRQLEKFRAELSGTESELANQMEFLTSNPDRVNEYVKVYLATLSDDLKAIDRQVAELDQIFLREQALANAMQSYVSQDESLQQDALRTQRLFDAVVARLEEINIIRDHGGDRMRVMAEPQLGKKVAPSLVKALALSGMVGAISGFGLAYLMDISESTFRSPDELRRTLRIPVMGMIPQLRRKSLAVKKGLESLAPTLVTAHHHGSNAAEAFRALRTSLFFSTRGQNHQVIQITSPLPGDGKSTLAANLAIAIAQAGKRVLLIDADFRRPTLHALFGRPKYSEYGLAEVVRGEVDPADEDFVTEIPNLSVMTCGARPENPSELLTSPAFQATLEMLRGRYDFIIVDTPPILAVTDPAAIAARVDDVLLAIRIRRGSRAATMRAQEVLHDVDANLLGVMVNAVDMRTGFGVSKYGHKYGYGYGYGYGYHYASEEYGESPADKEPEQLKLPS